MIEESLTNIVKHSQANHVNVTLSQFENGALLLTIEDDGVGFDVESVSNHGMSIGMRSMKMRVERIGGNFKIHSQQGYTIIQTEINLKSAA